MHALRWWGMDGRPRAARFYALTDYDLLHDVIEGYLSKSSPGKRPVRAALAIASPVTGDQVTMTNHPWTFSVDTLKHQFGLKQLLVINDFAANAAAVRISMQTSAFKSAVANRRVTLRSG